VAGGVDHSLVGGILAVSWDLRLSVCQVIEQYYAPSSEDRFSQLVALADFLGEESIPIPGRRRFRRFCRRVCWLRWTSRLYRFSHSSDDD